MTVVFLGYRPEKEVGAIARAAFDAVQGKRAPVVEPAAVRALPAGRPRLYALELTDPGGAAAGLQAAVSDALAAERFYTPERRAWWPHVTLARVKGGRRAPARAAPLAAETPRLGELRLPALTLYRSTLRPQGALYEPLERLELG